MQRFTSHGLEIVDDLARRHGFSRDAVIHLLFAVRDGNGGMAMFSHPEFGGPGQWMHGGMLMLSDPFNDSLKARVNALAHEISDVLADQQEAPWRGSTESHPQGADSRAATTGSGTPGLFAPDASIDWWPAELGTPNATGAQNDLRYAYFGDKRRLAVQYGDNTRVYDTLEHCINGVSQQQGRGSTITFTSQYGKVDLASLPVISCNGEAATPPEPSAIQPAAAAPSSGEEPTPSPGTGRSSIAAREADIFNALERLGDLKAKGILTDEEFTAKKAELLGRL